jgi:hypothetical protein
VNLPVLASPTFVLLTGSASLTWKRIQKATIWLAVTT